MNKISLPILEATGEHSTTPDWQQAIWKWCSLGLLAMILLLIVLVGVTLAQVMHFLETEGADNIFLFAGMAMITTNLLRLIAILIGGAIAFVGLAVSFFAHQKASALDADVAKEELGNAKAALATHSPGIVAVVVGAIVIISSVYAKTTHTYQPAYSGSQPSSRLRQLPPLPPEFREAERPSRE